MTETARTVLVTGASTGIGAATVTALVDAGYRVWASVRRQADADSLVADHGPAVRTLIMDVTDGDAVRAAGEQVVADGPLHALVNNAGAAIPGPLEYLPVDDFRRQLEVNLIGQLAVTQAVLPALRTSAEQTGDARIVMIGSIGGRVAGAMLGGYAAAKHGLVGLSGALRTELAPSGIKVLLIEPGSIATPIWSSGGRAGSSLMGRPEVYQRYGAMIDAVRALAKSGSERGLPPAAVAEVIRRAVTDRNPPPRQVVGRDAQIMAAVVRVLPFRAVYRLASGAAQQRGASAPPASRTDVG